MGPDDQLSPGACSGLRVLELSRGLAGPMVAMILADFGADVIRVESGEQDPVRGEPAYLLLNRGKKSIALDLSSEAGQDQLHRLARSVDVVVEALDATQSGDRRIGYEALSSLNPALVYCSITGFGHSGPLAHLKALDGLAMARAGIYRDQPGWHDEGGRPVFRASRDASYFAAMLALQGILAALRARDFTGRGQFVSTNLLQALACRQNPKVRWLLREGEDLPSESGETEQQDEAHMLPHHRDPREVSLIGMRVESKDGRWLMHSLSEPHFFPAWIDVIGLDWIWKDERFEGAPYRFPDTDTKLELVRIIEERMKEKTAEQWIAAYLANGNVCGDVVQTTQEALRNPQVTAIGGAVEVADPRVGATLQVGPLTHIAEVRAKIDAPAPLPGQHTDEVLSRLDRPVVVESVQGPPPTGGPLEGITIVEAAYYYATPFATSLLSDLGARVIKVEPLQGDPYRALAGGGGTGDPVLNLGHNNMVRAMQGKESIALNLKDPQGKKVMHQLIERADVFTHSFRAGAVRSLGIDYESVRRVNPTLVYQYGASYGSTGPYARQPAIDPVIAAFAGTTAYQAGAGNEPLTETGADPTAAAGHAVSMLLGLFARNRTGRGQYVEPAMIISNLYLNCEDAIIYEGKAPRPAVDGLQLGTGATYRLYETAPGAGTPNALSFANPDPRWVFLGVEDDEEFVRFCGVAGLDDLPSDDRFATREARAVHNGDLSERLEVAFRTRGAKEWESRLIAAGVGCVVADEMSNFAFLYRDPQAVVNNLMAPATHPSFGGVYYRHAPMVQLSETPGRGRAFCERGEHSQALLAELGYADHEIDSLKESGVVSWPTGEDEVATSALSRALSGGA